MLPLLNCFSRVRLCATPQTAAYQAPLSTGFSRQEYWSELPFQQHFGLPRWLRGKESACNSGDPGSISGSGRSAGGDGEGNGNPFQYSCLENPVDKGAWRAAVHGVAQSRTRLKRFSSSSSWRRDRLPIPVFLGFRCGPASKESARDVGDPSSIPGEGTGYPLQHSGLEDSMD